MPYFSSIAPKIGELGPEKFGVQGTACPIMPKVLATCFDLLIELVLLNYAGYVVVRFWPFFNDSKAVSRKIKLSLLH